MYKSKQQLLSLFREKANIALSRIQASGKTYKTQASSVNNSIIRNKEIELINLLKVAETEKWSNEEILKSILLLHYISNLVMIEFRNIVWPYEYMSFSRRVGELWEPFCKETFYHPVRNLTLVNAPDFESLQGQIKSTASAFINSLPVKADVKRELHYYYMIPWGMVDSGGINLELDLHFSQNGTNYNCDFKSGFSSNEKGNTNRLLLIGSIYRFLGEHEKTIIFVRQKEDLNNRYLQTLKNSEYWSVYCANEAYAKMSEYTGFNLRKWLDEFALWEEDMDMNLRKHLRDNDLMKYLTW